jgi:hypothetical protein
MAAAAAELEGTGAAVAVWDGEEGSDLASPADLLVAAAPQPPPHPTGSFDHIRLGARI